MIGAYLIDSVTQKAHTFDKWGEIATTTSTTIKCRIDEKNRIVTNEKGEQVVSMAKILIRIRTVAYSDLFTFNSIDHPVLKIAKAKDFSPRFLEVYVA